MTPELQEYLEKQGTQLIAVEQVLKQLIALFALERHDTIAENLRAHRRKLQKIRAEGARVDAMEAVIKLYEEALALEVVRPSSIGLAPPAGPPAPRAPASVSTLVFPSKPEEDPNG